ncbi:MAG: glycosyltransferase family 2 protein [Halothece sp. Uz-M2-17]|nr:glycosyltransferase family 2 protein [Halothece sp. Uz-M2-17]
MTHPKNLKHKKKENYFNLYWLKVYRNKIKNKFFYFRDQGVRSSILDILNQLKRIVNHKTQNTIAELPKSDHEAYQKWINCHYPRPADLKNMAKIAKVFSYQPKLTIIIPVWEGRQSFLGQALGSVFNQAYFNWELYIATSDDNQFELSQFIPQTTDSLQVIHATRKEDSFNQCINQAQGEFLIFLEPDDLLAPHALFEIALLLNEYPNADFIYSDEDKIQEEGKHIQPFFKPDWSPESFLSRMYTGHLGAYRCSQVKAIAGFRSGYKGSECYDLVLRLTELTNEVFHIPKILYHRRVHGQEVCNLLGTNDTNQATENALNDALSRRGKLGKAIVNHLGNFIIRYQLIKEDLVTIIIPTKNLGSTLDNCLTSIFNNTTYQKYEVLLIDNGSTEQEAIEVIKKWKTKEPKRFFCEILDLPFNFSRLNNLAAQKANGEYLVFLNNDTEVITPEWIEAMLEYAQQSSIGAVGVRLLYPDNTIQHAGLISIRGVAGHGHRYYPGDAGGYFNQIQTVNNYLAVTAACLMCRRKSFEEVGGFEESLAVAFNDVDLCLKLFAKGYRNVYLPHVTLYHYESKSRADDSHPEQRQRFEKEFKYMRNQWKYLLDNDPYYNPNLNQEQEDFSLIY